MNARAARARLVNKIMALTMAGLGREKTEGSNGVRSNRPYGTLGKAPPLPNAKELHPKTSSWKPALQMHLQMYVFILKPVDDKGRHELRTSNDAQQLCDEHISARTFTARRSDGRNVAFMT